ncbi:hypothetical protein FXO38_18444 [Capsicum annuum]|nr:hypothetical protein FXO38_18444 [Capsicum annuum]
MVHTEKVVEEEEEGWERCLEAKSRAINVLAFINFKKNCIKCNTIYHVEKEDTEKKQEDTEIVQTGDVVAAIEEIKKTNSKIGHKSLNIKDVEVDSEETMSENHYASDDIIRETIKGDVVEVEVSGQSSIASSSIIGSEEMLKVNVEDNDPMNDKVEREVPILD